MKILVVSLLRLSDVLLASSIIRSLKKNNPNAEIHLLMNKQFEAVAPLIPFVEKVFFFNREEARNIAGSESDRHFLEAYFQVNDLTERLRSEKYDKAINLTSNRLSGWLTMLADAKETCGFVYDKTGRASRGSTWFHYLQEKPVYEKENTFHFIDVFHYGAGLDCQDRRVELTETAHGALWAQNFLNQNTASKKIIVQPTASDWKKSLSPAKWKKALQLFYENESSLDVIVLGTPSEKDTVDEICAGTPFREALCSIEEAFSLLSRGHLFITGDASMKHVAASTKIKILEVSIGSSEYRKTGAYQAGVVILQSGVSCAPCSHQGPCIKSSHECAELISPEVLSLSAGAHLRNDILGLRLLAHEFSDEVNILRTDINESGDWSAYPLNQKFSPIEITSWIDRSTQKLLLQKEHEKQIGAYGTEGIYLKKILKNIFPDQGGREWISELQDIERDIHWFEARIENFLTRLKDVLTHIDDASCVHEFFQSLDQFCTDMAKQTQFEMYIHDLRATLNELRNQDIPFVIVRHLREKLSQTHQKTKIELKLIRGLQLDFTEVI